MVLKNKLSERNIFLDIVKYYAIFLVVWGHVVAQTSHFATYPVQEDTMVRLIYTTHMPLFMGICGYFFFKSISKYSSTLEYVQKKLPKRLLGLLIPMLSFGVIKTLCIQFFASNHPTSVIALLKMVVGNAKGVWFLGDLAVNTILVLIAWHFCVREFRHDWKYFLMVLPLSLIPVITYQNPQMYVFFVAGFWIAAYVEKDVLVKAASYWKAIAGIFLVAYLLFSYMPWPPEDFRYNFHEQSLFQLAVNDGLKFVLGFAGSFVSLALIHKYMTLLNGTWLYHRATVEGRFTLDIYLLQIVVVEIIGGHLHKLWLSRDGIDIFYLGGGIGRLIIPFLVTCIFMEIIVWISKEINARPILSKILFYR